MILHLICVLSLTASAQQQKFDLLSYTAPAGWQKDAQENLVVHKIVDQQKQTWAQVSVIRSTKGQGSVLADFTSEWKTLAAAPYGITAAPKTRALPDAGKWKAREGTGSFTFSGQPVKITLRTYSQGATCISVLAMTNSDTYQGTISGFFQSLKPEAVSPGPTAPESPPAAKPTPSAFTFTTTNFDDGWVSTVKEEWVEAKKGNITVLLHYPRPEDKKYISQQDEATRFFWNLYVAPRYSNLREFFLLYYSMSFEPPSFANGYLRDNRSGKDVFVTLFSKAKSGWIEIITPDRETFVKTFGIDKPDNYFMEWEPLQNLAGLNKFAVGENDLPGKWSNTFSAANSLYNIYTGIYVGATTYASAESFTFGKNRSYKWHIVASSGGTGMRTDVQQVKREGNFKMIGNWQIWFSTMQFKAKTYNAYFSCVKGGRILWLQDTEYGSYTAYGRVE